MLTVKRLEESADPNAPTFPMLDSYPHRPNADGGPTYVVVHDGDMQPEVVASGDERCGVPVGVGGRGYRFHIEVDFAPYRTRIVRDPE